MSDLDRVLDALLHDLRSPLGVAGGYLRLLRENRMADADAADRAIGKTQDALRTMTALCGEAGEWLKDPPATTTVVLPADAFLSQVATAATARGIPLEVVPGPPDARVTLALDVDRVVQALASLLVATTRDGVPLCRATVAETVCVVVVVPNRRAADQPGPFDPWVHPGLTAALASRTLTQAGGRCRRGGDAGEVVRIEFDVATATPTAA